MRCQKCSRTLNKEFKVCPYCETKVLNYIWIDTKAIEPLPEFLKIEYTRLKALVEDDKIFAAKFQLKDIFELILKLPISILASTLHTNDSLSDEEEKAFSQLLQEKISLGTWFKTIGSKFEKLDNENKPQKIVQLLSNVRVLFQKNEIDKWRNEDAHGALGFDTLSFKEEFIEKVDALNSFIVNNIDILSKLEIDFENKTILLEYNIINISPFLFTKKDSKEVFIYEGYKNRNGISKHLNYHNANTNEDKIESINKLAISLKTKIKTIADDSVNQDGTLKSEMTKLENLFDESDFERPHYIYDWIKPQLDLHSKGIFLFQTQRGMGKSTAIRHLSKQKFIKNNDFIVIPFYINNTYNFQANKMFQDIRYKLDNILGKSHNIDNPSPDKAKKVDVKKDFAKMLNMIHHYNDDKKILIVIDGLDEIPQNQDNENKSIYEVIPNSANLDDDIYFLLTSRVDEELTRNNQKALNKIDTLNKERFESNDERYIKVIKNYLQDLNLTEDELSNLLEKTDNRFLHISLLKQMYEYNLNINLDALDSNSLYEQYFKNIKHLYGDKLFSQAIKIMIAVANAQEPLTLNEILFIVNGDEDLTYKMIGFLTDFRKFFIVEDSYRGRVYTIYHDDIKEYILEAYGDVYKTMQDNWVKKYQDMTINDIDIECDGEVYVLTYGIDINHEVLKENTGFAKLLYLLAKDILPLYRQDTFSKSKYIYKRIEDYYLPLFSNIEKSDFYYQYHSIYARDSRAFKKSLNTLEKAKSYLEQEKYKIKMSSLLTLKLLNKNNDFKIENFLKKQFETNGIYKREASIKMAKERIHQMQGKEYNNNVVNSDEIESMLNEILPKLYPNIKSNNTRLLKLSIDYIINFEYIITSMLNLLLSEDTHTNLQAFQKILQIAERFILPSSKKALIVLNIIENNISVLKTKIELNRILVHTYTLKYQLYLNQKKLSISIKYAEKLIDIKLNFMNNGFECNLIDLVLIYNDIYRMYFSLRKFNNALEVLLKLDELLIKLNNQEKKQLKDLFKQEFTFYIMFQYLRNYKILRNCEKVYFTVSKIYNTKNIFQNFDKKQLKTLEESRAYSSFKLSKYKKSQYYYNKLFILEDHWLKKYLTYRGFRNRSRQKRAGIISKKHNLKYWYKPHLEYNIKKRFGIQ